MSKKNKYENVVITEYANSYVMSRVEASSPYVANYLASKNLRQEQLNQPRNAFRSQEGYDSLESGYGAADARTRTLPNKRKGIPLAIIMLLLVVVFIAVAALSFLNVLPEYTSVFIKPTDLPEGEGEDVFIPNKDIFMGFIKSFNEEMEVDSIFYNECLTDLENVEMINKIAYDALPIALALGLVLALIILISLVVYVFKSKGRLFILLLSIFLFVANIAFLFGGFIWAAGSMDFGQIMKFLPFGEEQLSMVLSYGSIASVGISLLLLLSSIIFFFTSRKAIAMR